MQPDAWDQSSGHRAARTIAALFMVGSATLILVYPPLWFVVSPPWQLFLFVAAGFALAAAALAVRVLCRRSDHVLPVAVYAVLAAVFAGYALALRGSPHDAG